MTPDVSLFMPGIRTHLWPQLIDTFKKSCTKSSWEIVIAGPFPPPAEIAKDIIFIQTYACPSSAAQQAAIVCRGRLLLHCVDDARFIPGAVDAAVAQHNEFCCPKDLVNTRYTEAEGYAPNSLPLAYWDAHHHKALQLPGIPATYKLAIHFLANREYFQDLGGFDCAYVYQNFNLHQFAFRVQADGGRIFLSPGDVTNCDHLPGASGDHGPIHDSHDIDFGRFCAELREPNALGNRVPIRLSLDNWKQQPAVWPLRFRRPYKTYGEMITDH